MGVIDVGTISARFLRIKPLLDERARRLFVANEALSLGRGGVTAVAAATGMARVAQPLPAANATDTGLTVTCDIDQGCYPKSIEVSDAEMAALNIQRDAFHGEWNYTISPRGRAPP